MYKSDVRGDLSNIAEDESKVYKEINLGINSKKVVDLEGRINK